MKEAIKAFWVVMLLSVVVIPGLAFASLNTSSSLSSPMAAPQIIEKARKNNNWKFAFATGKHAQIVLMSVSPETNPKNEIGMETHPFDQVIIVASGDATAILNGQSSNARSGDLIFIPLGTPHNVVNLNANKPLKLISIYSDTDIPANAVYKKKSDESH